MRLWSPTLPRLLGAIALLSACSTTQPPPAYHGEAFDAQSPFRFASVFPPNHTCEFGQRALLSQGYQVNVDDPLKISGEKFFQPKPDYVIRIDITLVCLNSEEGAGLYANARQTRYEVKSGGHSAGLSVAGVGSISLPWSSDKESLIKVGEETIADRDFYRRLFSLIETLSANP